jgi:mannose-6-phosphate isomerase-like protein (cupin superfamily)
MKRGKMKTIAANAIRLASLALAAALLPSMAWGQSATVDHWTQSEMLAKGLALTSDTAQTGSASAKLTEYPHHYTMIALRKKDGGAEIHENFADFFYVVRGKATLLTGGTLANAKTVSAGEMRGTAVEGGTRTSLAKGDVVHIPAHVAHQLLLPGGGTFIYFVVKVQEQ